MILAGHYPKQHFTIAELLAMLPAPEPGTFVGDGRWHLGKDNRGKPLAFYAPGLDDPKPHCVVRPVVRVKAPCIPSLDVMIKRASAWFNSLTPAEQEAHRKAQRESYVRGEMELSRLERDAARTRNV